MDSVAIPGVRSNRGKESLVKFIRGGLINEELGTWMSLSAKVLACVDLNSKF